MPTTSKSRSGKSKKKKSKTSNSNNNTSKSVTNIPQSQNTKTNTSPSALSAKNKVENWVLDQSVSVGSLSGLSNYTEGGNTISTSCSTFQEFDISEGNKAGGDKDNSTSGIKSFSTGASTGTGRLKVQSSGDRNDYLKKKENGPSEDTAEQSPKNRYPITNAAIPNSLINLTDDEHDFLSNHSDVTTKSSNPFRLEKYSNLPKTPNYHKGGPLDFEESYLRGNFSLAESTTGITGYTGSNNCRKSSRKVTSTNERGLRSETGSQDGTGTGTGTGSRRTYLSSRQSDTSPETLSPQDAIYEKKLNHPLVTQYFTTLLCSELHQSINNQPSKFTDVYDALPKSYTKETVEVIKENVRDYLNKSENISDTRFHSLKAKSSWLVNRIQEDSDLGREFAGRLEAERKGKIKEKKESQLRSSLLSKPNKSLKLSPIKPKNHTTASSPLTLNNHGFPKALKETGTRTVNEAPEDLPRSSKLSFNYLQNKIQEKSLPDPTTLPIMNNSSANRTDGPIFVTNNIISQRPKSNRNRISLGHGVASHPQTDIYSDIAKGVDLISDRDRDRNNNTHANNEDFTIKAMTNLETAGSNLNQDLKDLSRYQSKISRTTQDAAKVMERIQQNHNLNKKNLEPKPMPKSMSLSERTKPLQNTGEVKLKAGFYEKVSKGQEDLDVYTRNKMSGYQSLRNSQKTNGLSHNGHNHFKDLDSDEEFQEQQKSKLMAEHLTDFKISPTQSLLASNRESSSNIENNPYSLHDSLNSGVGSNAHQNAHHSRASGSYNLAPGVVNPNTRAKNVLTTGKAYNMNAYSNYNTFSTVNATSALEKSRADKKAIHEKDIADLSKKMAERGESNTDNDSMSPTTPYNSYMDSTKRITKLNSHRNSEFFKNGMGSNNNHDTGLSTRLGRNISGGGKNPEGIRDLHTHTHNGIGIGSSVGSASGSQILQPDSDIRFPLDSSITTSTGTGSHESRESRDSERKFGIEMNDLRGGFLGDLGAPKFFRNVHFIHQSWA